MLEALKEKVYAFAQPKVYEIAKGQLSKHERSDRFAAVHDELQEFIKTGLNLAEGLAYALHIDRRNILF